ncbi:hypothetical protein GCM10028802_31750 [Terrabacter terrigena]
MPAIAETTLSTAAPAIVPTTPSREPRAAAVAAAMDPPSSWVRERSKNLDRGSEALAGSGSTVAGLLAPGSGSTWRVGRVLGSGRSAVNGRVMFLGGCVRLRDVVVSKA